MAEPDRARRPVAIDWDDLEMALTANPAEFTCYLDERTGEILMAPVGAFAGDSDWPSEEEIEAGLDAGHLVPIDPLGAHVEWDWMALFAASVRDRRLRERLDDALHGSGAFRRFKDVLRANPSERERWFALRDERVREAARDWLEAHGIEPLASRRAGEAPGA